MHIHCVGGTECGTGLEHPPLLFDLKILYSYVIEVADSESDLGLHSKALVSEIFAFYHLLEYARGRPARRGHVHFGQNFLFRFFMRVMSRVTENSVSTIEFYRLFLIKSNELC